MRAQAIDSWGYSRPAALRRGFGLFSTTPHSHGPFEVFRKAGSGAGAGILALSAFGAIFSPGGESNPFSQLSSSLSASTYDFSTANGLAAALLDGVFNEPLQILGAIFVFLSAGRCIARFVGLAAVLLLYIAYSQGLTLTEVLTLAENTQDRISAAYTAFMNPESVDEIRVAEGASG